METVKRYKLAKTARAPFVRTANGIVRVSNEIGYVIIDNKTTIEQFIKKMELIGLHIVTATYVETLPA